MERFSLGLPNYITFLRVFITPFFMLFYLKGASFGFNQYVVPCILFFLVILSELSDAFDGFLARKFSQVTDLGKLLDPTVDSIYRISVFLTFTQPPVNLPLFIVFVFLSRDSVISALRTVCALRGRVLAARISGKIKAIFQGISCCLVCFMMILYSLSLISINVLTMCSSIVIGFSAFYSVLAGLDYIWINKNEILFVFKKKDV